MSATSAIPRFASAGEAMEMARAALGYLAAAVSVTRRRERRRQMGARAPSPMTGVVRGDPGGKPGPFGMMDVPHRPAAPTVQVNVRQTRGLLPANRDRASDDGRTGGLVGQLAAQ